MKYGAVWEYGYGWENCNTHTLSNIKGDMNNWNAIVTCTGGRLYDVNKQSLSLKDSEIQRYSKQFQVQKCFIQP